MKANDLKLPEGMEVYVDMDGVLADFFTEYAKLAGIESGNYRDIPPAKTDPTLNKMVGTDFFARLPKFPTADKLLQMVVQAADSYNICSSPLRGDHEGSAHYKKVWINKHLNIPPKNIYIVSNKAKYAKNANGMPNVLIDDRGSNITAWEAAGGIGIKYQADEDSLQKILDGFKRARRVGQGDEKHEPQKLQSLDRGKMIAVHSSGDKDEEVKENIDTDLKSVLRKFFPIAMKQLGIKKLPKIVLLKKIDNSDQPTFGKLENDEKVIYVGVKNRHPLDIMRTLAHELVHWKQLTHHQLNKNSGETGSSDENEAHAIGGVIMRHFNKKYPNLFDKPAIESIQEASTSWQSMDPKAGRALLGAYREASFGVEQHEDEEGANRISKELTRVASEFSVKPQLKNLYNAASHSAHMDYDTNPGHFKNWFWYVGEFLEKIFGQDDEPDFDINKQDEDQHPNEQPRGPEVKPTMPAGTVRVDVSDVYDWYKLGQHISNMKGLGKHDFGKGPPSTIFSFGSEEEEHKYIKGLEKSGLTTTDIDPKDPKQPKKMKRQKTDPTYNVDENFADGKNPQDKGDSKRHGIRKGMTIAQLKKIRSSDSASPRKKQLAHWQINMRQGKKK